MKKSTKIVALTVGTLLVVPPYIASMIALLGGHLNYDQANVAGFLAFIGAVYWVVVCSILGAKRNHED